MVSPISDPCMEGPLPNEVFNFTQAHVILHVEHACLMSPSMEEGALSMEFNNADRILVEVCIALIISRFKGSLTRSGQSNGNLYFESRAATTDKIMKSILYPNTTLTERPIYS